MHVPGVSEKNILYKSGNDKGTVCKQAEIPSGGTDDSGLVVSPLVSAAEAGLSVGFCRQEAPLPPPLLPVPLPPPPLRVSSSEPGPEDGDRCASDQTWC